MLQFRFIIRLRNLILNVFLIRCNTAVYILPNFTETHTLYYTLCTQICADFLIKLSNSIDLFKINAPLDTFLYSAPNIQVLKKSAQRAKSSVGRNLRFCTVLQFENLRPWAIGRGGELNKRDIPWTMTYLLARKSRQQSGVSSPNCRATKPEGKNIGAFPTSMFP